MLDNVACDYDVEPSCYLQFVKPFDISSDDIGEYSRAFCILDDSNAAIDTHGFRQLGEFPMQALLCESDSIGGCEIREAHTTEM